MDFLGIWKEWVKRGWDIGSFRYLKKEGWYFGLFHSVVLNANQELPYTFDIMCPDFISALIYNMKHLWFSSTSPLGLTVLSRPCFDTIRFFFFWAWITPRIPRDFRAKGFHLKFDCCIYLYLQKRFFRIGCWYLYLYLHYWQY